MARIPLSDEALDPTEDGAEFLDDTDFDGHYDELDFEDDPFEVYDEDDDLDDPLEDEQDYGTDEDDLPAGYYGV